MVTLISAGPQIQLQVIPPPSAGTSIVLITLGTNIASPPLTRRLANVGDEPTNGPVPFLLTDIGSGMFVLDLGPLFAGPPIVDGAEMFVDLVTMNGSELVSMNFTPAGDGLQQISDPDAPSSFKFAVDSAPFRTLPPEADAVSVRSVRQCAQCDQCFLLNTLNARTAPFLFVSRCASFGQGYARTAACVTLGPAPKRQRALVRADARMYAHALRDVCCSGVQRSFPGPV